MAMAFGIAFALFSVLILVFFFCAVLDHKRMDEDSENLSRSLNDGK